MANRFKLRNFDDHHKNFVFNDNPERLKRSVIESNRQYDLNAGVTHRFIHYPDDSVRLVSDVELIMSNDPYVSSYTPQELRNSLYRQLTSTSSKVASPRLSDEQLFNTVPSSFGHEISDTSFLSQSFLNQIGVSNLSNNKVFESPEPTASVSSDSN